MVIYCIEHQYNSCNGNIYYFLDYKNAYDRYASITKNNQSDFVELQKYNIPNKDIDLAIKENNNGNITLNELVELLIVNSTGYNPVKTHNTRRF